MTCCIQASGSAFVFGLDSHRASREIRARLGNLPGDFSCERRLTGREFLGFCAEARGIRGLGSASVLAQRFEADLDRKVGDLSSGNRQKIGLIQALFHDPELLILDEPTTGLDPLMQEEFLAVIGEYRERGGTVFLSSHDLDEVERICDRVAIIREGRLAAVENVADLRGRAYHHVSIEFDAPVDGAEFARHRRSQRARSRRCARALQSIRRPGPGGQGGGPPHGARTWS